MSKSENIKPLKLRGLKEKMGFGKYKEKTVEQIAVLNPSYLLWAHNNVEFFELAPEVLKKVDAQAQVRSHERHARNAHWNLEQNWDVPWFTSG
jgi:hypothetical protein